MSTPSTSTKALFIAAIAVVVAGVYTTSVERKENLKLQSSHGKTPEERAIESGTTAPTPHQTGPPKENTLPPIPPETGLPAPETRHIMMPWSDIPKQAKRVFIGANLRGNYLSMKSLAYFVIMQTPPTSPDDIYGNFALFVEGGKIGIKIHPRTVITQHNFDFNHHLNYKIEVVLVFKSAYVTRVELHVDGASMGITFEIRDVNMRDNLLRFSDYMLLNDKVKDAHMQIPTAARNDWGSIVETPIKDTFM
jgi:hypothetical protein